MKKQYFKNFRKEGLPGGPNELIINSEGFILSENGQWEFPGLPTVIPSSDITMEDVPYPVLGISDTGDTQMMYPEEDYQFDGDMVYELPMAQKGYNVKPRKGSILLEGETEPSTHLMRREYIPNTGWVAFPSLFQNEDGTWVDMSKEEDWMNIYDEANRRGEVYNFGENKRKAIKFADKGSWKKDLGIKKQGGGDISIPDLTKPNWLDTLPNQYAGGGDLPPMEVNTGLPKYGKKRVLNLKDYTKQNTTSNRFPVVQNPFSRENKINLHLPENYGEEHRRLEVNPYFGGINVEPDFNVYYGGVDADLNLLNKNNNILDLRGGLNTDLVTYPGGSEFTSVNPSIGLSFTRKFAEGGWLDNLPKAQPGGTREPIYVDPNDLLGMQRYNAYNDSLNLYKAYRMQDKLMGPGSRVVHSEVIPGEWSIRELLDRRKKKYNSHLRGFFADDWQSEEHMRRAIPIGDEQNSFDLIKYYKSLGFTDKDIMYHTSPDIVSDKIRPIGTYMDGSFNSPIYKKPVQPYAIRKTEPRTPYSPVQTNPNSTVQLPINNIPLQQIPTIGIGEPTFEGNNAYWKKQDNQLIYQNNDYSNNRNLPISNKPGDRFHQEPSWMVGDDRYYERDGEAYLVPQPKGGWKNKQILDPSSGKWKSKIVKKTNGGWLNNLPKAQKGNTGKQSANESWGLTQESQLSDLTKGLLNNILHRQAFAESSFNPKVISGDKTSRVGALGMTQIMPETLNEYINKTGDKNINILDPKDAVKVQKWYMQDLLNADFIHKPNQSEKVRMVKALGSYNWGRGNMSKFLGKQKKKGVDIYSDELSWVNDLPVETRDYVNKIVLGTNEKFNQEYKQNSSKYKDYYQNGGSAKLLNRSRKEIIKQRELEENLRKEGFNEDGVFTRVLPEYTVKSPEKKLYDEAFQDALNKQKSFQNKWYPGDISEGVLDNMKQRANVIASDKVAKNILENNKVKDLKDYQKEYIANSNYSGKLRPGIFKEFTEGVQDLGRITQGKLPTTKALGILSPLEYPINLVRGTVKGEGLDALKGKISSPWIDASKVDIGAVNDVGVYNTMTDLALDPLNLSGTGALLGRTGVKHLNKVIKTSKESGVLSNAYKYNPWAFKPNPEAYYRVLGKEGINDALESGVIRANPKNIHPFSGQPVYDKPYFSKGVPFDRDWKSPFKNKKGKQAVGSIYPDETMVEVFGHDKFYPTNDLVTSPSVTLTPFDEGVNLYKRDWLRGYKEVPKNNNINTSPVQAGFPNPLGIVDAVFPRINPLGFIDKVGPMDISPLNLLPFYGKKLGEKGQLFRKFGNSMDDVTKRGVLSPSGGSKLRMGRSQIVNEGNWAAMDAPNEQYPGVFEATMNPKLEESNLGFKSIPKRNGVLVTDKAGNNLLEIPLTDPGLSFNRRLPFSNRYVPINKEKLINKKFQLSTQLPHLQSITEKYGVGLGIAGVAELMGLDGAIDKYNKYTVDPIINWSKDQYDKLTNDKKANGGWLDKL